MGQDLKSKPVVLRKIILGGYTIHYTCFFTTGQINACITPTVAQTRLRERGAQILPLSYLYFNRICKGSPASRPFPNSYLNTYFIDVGPPIIAMVELRHGSNKHCPQTQDSFQVMQSAVFCVSVITGMRL